MGVVQMENKEYLNNPDFMRHVESEWYDYQKRHGEIKTFCCSKCRKETKYVDDFETDAWLHVAKSSCWHIYLGRAGYGSGLDGSDVNFGLCDDCLIEFINTFPEESQNEIRHSGSNQDWSTYEDYYLNEDEENTEPDSPMSKE
jgi:hypothetical protein